MPAGRPRKTAEGSRTTRRGYDGEHKKARARELRNLREGEPCPFCGRGMFLDQDLDFDHIVPVALGGKEGPKRLSHAPCNRSAGGKLAASIRAGRERRVAPPAAPVQLGTPCYGCGQPLEDGQRLQSGPAAFGSATLWSHARCSTRWTSVPADRL